MNEDATQFSYFRDNELTQLADMTMHDEISDSNKTLEEGSTFLNKYKILKVLGEGSFSLIYLLEALDASKKLLVAKEFFPKGFVTRNKNNEVILKTSLSEKEIENFHFMKDIFIGEAQNLVKVSKRAHPNVLNFFALEENVNNTMYLITDYEEGITLKEYIKERKKEHKGKLTSQEIVGIATGLLNGLGHVHKVKVYHQDIKLENILMRQDQYPLLLDFGASITLYDKKQKKYFNATTPRYAAPEQVELSQPPKIDQRTDIYELGVLLYKLITDEFPPKASERLKAQSENKESYIPLETQKPYGYELNILRAVDRALELKQENRFQNAEEFKKALLRKKSYKNVFLVGFAGVIALLLGAMYVFWPTPKGTIKLNLEQKKYFVYSDGEKVLLSQEKTILLPEGIHQLTIIKDGYIPKELNVTIKANSIKTISSKLVPRAHKIILSTNIPGTSFRVNGEKLVGNTFEGEVGDVYTIETDAPHYISTETKTEYMKLHQNHFKFYQELKLVETNVKVIIDRPLKIGKNTIKINGSLLNGNTFIAKYNQAYKIVISNPYYKTMYVDRSYETLDNNKEQKITLSLGVGDIILKGLPAGVVIKAYRKYLNKITTLISLFTYAKNEYTAHISTGDQIYLNISKEGYETIKTPIIDIQNNTKYVNTFILKKMIVEAKATKTVIEKNIEKNTTKKYIALYSNDVLKDTKINVNLKKKKKKKKKETVKYKVKRGDTLFTIAQAHHTTVNEVRRQNNFRQGKLLKEGKVLTVLVNTYFREKSIKIKEKRQPIKSTRKRKSIKKTKSGYVWYCVASADGVGTWSASASSKQNAARAALNKCHQKRKASCGVSNCYILGNSYQ